MYRFRNGSREGNSGGRSAFVTVLTTNVLNWCGAVREPIMAIRRLGADPPRL
jgi:hypothetical protein